MTILLATLALVAAVLIGGPMAAAGMFALLYVVAASGGRPSRNDAVWSVVMMIVGLGAVVLAALHLGSVL